MPSDVALPPPLADLAAHHGVATDFWDWQGNHLQVSAETIRAVLTAMGVPVESDADVETALADADLAGWRRTVPPTVVARVGWTPWVPVHVRHGAPVRLTIELEDGTVRPATQVDWWVDPREIDGALIGEATFELPGDLPLGWHRLVVVTGESGAEPTTVAATATLIVTPQRLTLPAAVDREQVWGLQAQVYQAQTRNSWGFGDLGDLTHLVDFAAARGGEFVLVNPLHAAEPIAPMEPSPYLPTTRRFVNPIYLRVADVPGHADVPPAAARLIDDLAAQGRALLTQDFIDRDTVWALKSEALRIVFEHVIETPPVAFTDYLAREGDGLTHFATWCALAVEHGLPWSQWPAELQDPTSAAVAQFQVDHADEVQFHAWLQWCTDLQLHDLQRRALEAGMGLGIVHDLAVGVHPQGADAWALADVLAAGVEVGAPPDQFNQLGQKWAQPPWRPDRLAEVGYAPYRDMLRTVLTDSGGIRVDHIIGLFRLWWVPSGLNATEGTYVRYDHEAFMGILLLEAHRAGAVVVGEDLGTVEPWMRDVLTERGVLGTSITWFEWADGAPLPPERYRELCLSSVYTHDLPPTAGYLELEHVAIRERLGLLTRSVEEERAAERASLDKVEQALRERGLVGESPSVDEMVVGLHRWLAQTSSRLLGVALPDLVGDRRAVNQPGTSNEYPNWRVPLTNAARERVWVEDLPTIGLAEDLAGVFAARRE
ncbi:4-alpha-glucanotransferase [Kribbia dieselivorans]|uniref:4-alpha-glucanotransferase n=1 Tax=Kribbia dieselivorans TaxID=331526 RepID=UPI000A744FAE|nr:4-alpha-glucanotransferase [Kribbia dieselivorans]